MKDSFNRELFEYYNERAAEYEAFYYGKFPTLHPEPDIYINDRQPIQPLLSQYISGKCVDIACGTGFWLPYYHQTCSSITLIDQSKEMLSECSKKIHQLGIEDKTKIIRSNIFNPSLADGTYENALIGFLISHFNDSELANFFYILKSFLVKSGTFVIIDSIWNDEIKTFRRVKAGMNKRALFNGREFQIFKRFFDKKELQKIARQYNLNLKVVYWGKLFFLACGQFYGNQA